MLGASCLQFLKSHKCQRRVFLFFFGRKGCWVRERDVGYGNAVRADKGFKTKHVRLEILVRHPSKSTELKKTSELGKLLKIFTKRSFSCTTVTEF